MRETPPPSGWSRTTMGRVARFLNGYPFKPRDWHETGTPIIRIAQMTDRMERLDRYPGVVPPENRIDTGDLLFSWSATLMTLIWDRGPAYLNQHIFKVVPQEGSDLRFIHHLLDWNMEGLAGHAHGTTMRHIRRADLLPYPVAAPPLEEQRVIAEMLDTLDDAIRRTEQVIAKLHEMKQGLLHDLLTRGVDEHGDVRPLASEAPDLYKNSPAGKIPEEWRHTTVQEVSEKIADRDHTTPTYVSDGVLMVSPTHFVDDEGVDFRRCPRISRRDHEQNSRKTDLRADDVVIHRIGAGLGGVRLVRPEWPEISILHSLAMIRPSCKAVVPGFLLWALRSDAVGRQMGLGTQSIGVPDLGLEKIGGLQLPLPGLPEQSRIVGVLSGFQEQLEGEKESLEKLRSLKDGLQHDLFTGRARVPIPVQPTT